MMTQLPVQGSWFQVLQTSLDMAGIPSACKVSAEPRSAVADADPASSYHPGGRAQASSRQMQESSQ